MTTRFPPTRWTPLRVLAVPLSLAFAMPTVDASARVAGKSPTTRKAKKTTKASSVNRIDGLTVEELDDGATILRLQGTAKPTFNVYRLKAPDRIVVDIAGSERGKVVPHVPLDTWACGRVSIDAVEERGAKLVRVVVQLKREASYIVVPDGGKLVVTLTPREVPPEAYFARKSAGKRRAEIERDQRDAKKLKHSAGKLERDAQSLKAEARALQSVAATKHREAQRAAKKAKQRAQSAKNGEARAKQAEARAQQAAESARKTLAEAKTHRVGARRALRKAEAERERAEEERKQLTVARKHAEAALHKSLEDANAKRKAADQARKRAALAEASAKTKLADAERQAAAKVAEAQHTLSQARAEADKAQAAAKKTLASAKAKLAAAEAEASRRVGAAKRKEKQADSAAAARLSKAQKQAEKAVGEARQQVEQAEQRARQAERRSAAKEEAARKRVAEANRRVAAAEREAGKQLAQARSSAKEIRARANKALADAEKAMLTAEQERKKAAGSRARAERELAKAKRAAAKAKKTGKESASVERAVAQAKQAHSAAQARQKTAETNLQRLRADRNGLRDKLAAQQVKSEKLQQTISARKRQLAALEGQVSTAKKQLAVAGGSASKKQLEASRSKARRMQATATVLEKEVQRLRTDSKGALRRAKRAERRVHELERNGAARVALDRARRDASKAREAANQAKDELAKRERRLARVESKVATLQKDVKRLAAQRKSLESQGKKLARKNKSARRELEGAEAKLAKVKKSLATERSHLEGLHADVERAQSKLDQRLASIKEGEKVGSKWKRDRKAAATTRLKDVTFENSPTEERVILLVDGPIEYSGSTLTPTMQMLRLTDAEIPSKLERSLDASGYDGPVKTITSFGEDDDVKVIVSTRDGTKPTLEEKPGKLIWRFPRKAKTAGRTKSHAKTKTKSKSEVVSMAGTKVGGFATPPMPRAAAAAAAAPPARTSRRRGRFRGERIDIELQQAPVKDVLLLFSDIGRVNIIAGRGVDGQVTMKLTAVPWDQALDIILRSLNLGMVREGNVIRVATLEDLENERRAAIDRANAQIQQKPLETRLVSVSYATVDEMIPKVQSVLSSRGSVTPDSRTNKLIIMDVPENIRLAQDLVEQLDSQTPQVLIEARIVEARTNFLRQLGIQWGFDFIASPGTGNPTGLLFPNSVGIGGGATGQPPDTRGMILPPAATNPNYAVDLPAPVGTGAGGAIGFSFGSLSGNLNTNLRLSAAEDTGEVRIISAPKIVTLDNVEAQIEQGVQIPISQVSAQGVNTRYVNATLALRVTPHVTNEGAVLMDVTVQKNEADFINTGARGDPTILTKQAQSRMLVFDGDTAVIGGIYTRNKSVNFKKVPWIADIPIIGWFFKNKSEADTRTEVLIFLTPKIVNRPSSIGG